MPLQPHELDCETEITYWRDRVSSLEALVGELLKKNQALRSLLRSAIPKGSSVSAAEMNKPVSENSDSSSSTSNSSF